METTEIRTASYMTMKGKMEEWREIIKSRNSYISKVEFYNKGNDWYAIGYYNNGDEFSEELTEHNIPGGWMDINQATARYLEQKNK